MRSIAIVDNKVMIDGVEEWISTQFQPAEWCMKSKELAEQLIGEYGDDYKLMMGVL